MRRFVGITVGALLAVLVLASWAVTGMALIGLPAAHQVPLHTHQVASRLLFEMDEDADRAIGVSVARAALSTYPFSARALLRMHRDAVNNGDAAKAAAYLELSGRGGWHDEVVQRETYRELVAAGNFDDAMRHLEALLRRHSDERAWAAEAIARDLNRPGYAAALTDQLAQDQSWTTGFLHVQGSTLPNHVLTDIARQRASGGKPLGRDVAAPLVARLLETGRVQPAVAIAQSLYAKPDGALAPDWPDDAARRQPTAFDWSIPPGYTVLTQSGKKVLMRTRARATRPVAVRLALKPGRYTLASADRQTARPWRYGFSCDRIEDPRETIGAGSSVVVSQGCPVQFLSVGAESAGAQVEPLAPLSLTPQS
ncbi:hypothetical protein ACXYL9_04960 [Qipengyuania sp. CAU 1752]